MGEESKKPQVDLDKEHFTKPFTRENLHYLDKRVRYYKFVRVGDTISFGPTSAWDHPGILIRLSKDQLNDSLSLEDAGHLAYQSFSFFNPNKLEISVYGGSESFWIEENTEARKVTIELIRKVLEGTNIGLHLK